MPRSGQRPGAVASRTQHLAHCNGATRGAKYWRWWWAGGQSPASRTRELRTNPQGFSLHARVHCEANNRQGIEQLCRYITRPAVSTERQAINRDGNVVLKLKTAWRNGTTRIPPTPMEFMLRPATLGPKPRLHLIRVHGVLAPDAQLRSKIVPTPTPQTTADAGDCQHAHSAPLRMT